MAEWTDNASWLNENLPKTIREKASFIKLLDHFGIEYFPASSGSFDHKMKCPLPIHDGGSEKTASCFFSEKTNSFCCFGCNSGHDIIDFVKLYKGIPFGEALKWLAEFAGITSSEISTEEVVKEKKDPEKTVKIWIMRAGVEMRKFLEEYKGKSEYEKLCEKSEKVFAKLDEMLDNITDENYLVAKEYYDKLHIKLAGVK